MAYCELKEKKYSEALHNYDRIKEKDADIFNRMGLCYENKKSYKEAAQYYSKAGSKGDKYACLNYAKLLRNGRYDLRKNRSKAYKWAKKSLKLGNKEAEKYVKEYSLSGSIKSTIKKIPSIKSFVSRFKMYDSFKREVYAELAIIAVGLYSLYRYVNWLLR